MLGIILTKREWKQMQKEKDQRTIEKSENKSQT